MELARLGNKLEHHMTLAQLGELSKTIAWISIPARESSRASHGVTPSRGMQLIQHLNLIPARDLRKTTPLTFDPAWVINHAGRKI